MADEVAVDRVDLIGLYETPIDLPVVVDRLDALGVVNSTPDTQVDALRASGVYMDHPYVPPVNYVDHVFVDRTDGAGLYHTDADTQVDALRASGVYMDHPYVPPVNYVNHAFVDRVEAIGVLSNAPSVNASRLDMVTVYAVSNPDTSADRVDIGVLYRPRPTVQIDAVRLVVLTSATNFNPRRDNFGGAFKRRWARR